MKYKSYRLFGVVAALSVSLVASASQAQAGRPVAQALLVQILAKPVATPPAGAPEGKVTIVEYFDYDCPVCRGMEPELQKFILKHPKVRLIRKDWPVFGDASIYAALCSFAAAREGKYSIAHDALISSKGDLDARSDVQTVLREAGFDVKKIDADIASHEKEYRATIARNEAEASALGLRGTPGLIIGHELIPGSLNEKQLERLVRNETHGDH